MARRLGALVAHPAFPFLLLASLLVAVAVADQDAGGVESYALLAFKSSVSSDPAGLLSSWSIGGGDRCSWPGIACSGGGFRSGVTAVNISGTGGGCRFPRFGHLRRSCSDPGRRLSGVLSPEIGELSELRILSLPFNSFHGEIPSSVWGLRDLEVLDLEGNSLSGALPSRFPPSLRVLNLRSNLIHGAVPPSLASCARMETLDLSDNRLDGSISGIFTSCNLGELYLSFNRLGGRIPDEIGSSCASLRRLDLSGNRFAGAIPRSLGNCGEFESVILFSNLLDGSIPSELGKLVKLRSLDVSRNSLSGYIPPELGNCKELSVLVLSNLFDPMIGGEGSSAAMDEFNTFQMGIPESITGLRNLRILWAPRASLEGEIPSDWGACQSLEMLNLGHNLFAGAIPTALGKCKNLKFLNLSSNMLSGVLSEELQVPCMDIFDISRNRLSGPIPKFSQEQCNSLQQQQQQQQQQHLRRDDLSSVYLSFFAERAQKEISLLSYRLGGDEYAIVHDFGENNFTGSVPFFKVVAAERAGGNAVYTFLAGGNNLFASSTDDLFGMCRQANGLIANFSGNMISGEIPQNIGFVCRSLILLDVSENRISGTIPESFGLLNRLIAADLSNNRLHDEIPASLSQLKVLEFLSLAGNNLRGHIPSQLGQLISLRVLDLSSNRLSGEIPSALVSLKNRTFLRLDNNKLSGNLPPGFVNATALSLFNVSHNNLSCPFPFNMSSNGCDAAYGNPSLLRARVLALSISPSGLPGRNNIANTYSYPPPPPPPSSPTPSSSTGFNSIEIASITSASAIVSVLLALIVLYIYTRKCAPRSSSLSSATREVTLFTDIGVPLTYDVVVRATGNFNASNCIGSGGFGATYKAEVAPGVLVAIKRLSVGRIQGLQQFHAEIKTLGRWRHPNLVTLIGYHVSEAEMFLVYNYLPGGNLERFINERLKRPIDWKMLHKIALDVARALAYLHDHCVPRILHRDVKPSNILLDNDFSNAYLSDFGLARLLGNSETHATTGVAGTFGYVAPEYAMTCRVSDKADVYSYGVVLLELVSDKKALDPSFTPYGNGFNIVAWACMLLRQGRAREFFVEGLWDVGPHDDLVEILHLGVMCTVDSLSIRPTMKQVVQRLKQLQPPTC